MLNKYSSMLTRNLHSAQKCSDEDFYFISGLQEKMKRVLVRVRVLELKRTSQETLFLRIVKNENN